MEYIKNNLLANEKIITFARPHWILFSAPIFYFIITLLLLVYGSTVLPVGFAVFKLEIHQILACIVFLLVIYTGINTLITFYTSEYGITNKRIIMKEGWIRRNSLEIFLDKVEAIRVSQTIPGRILNYGSLLIIGTGGSKDPFRFVPKPLEFRKSAQQQIDVVRNT